MLYKLRWKKGGGICASKWGRGGLGVENQPTEGYFRF